MNARSSTHTHKHTHTATARRARLAINQMVRRRKRKRKNGGRSENCNVFHMVGCFNITRLPGIYTFRVSYFFPCFYLLEAESLCQRKKKAERTGKYKTFSEKTLSNYRFLGPTQKIKQKFSRTFISVRPLFRDKQTDGLFSGKCTIRNVYQGGKAYN